MKILNAIKNFFICVFGIAFFAFAVVMSILLLNYNDYGVTQFDTTSLIIINDTIASENYAKGNLVTVKQTKLDNIAVGDEIFAYKVDSKGNVSIDLGNVGEIYKEENAIAFENGSTYSADYIIGKADKVYENVGTFLSIIESKWGFFFIILIPCFLIFIYEIYALIVEIKYGSEDEETEEPVKKTTTKKKATNNPKPVEVEDKEVIVEEKKEVVEEKKEVVEEKEHKKENKTDGNQEEKEVKKTKKVEDKEEKSK